MPGGQGNEWKVRLGAGADLDEVEPHLREQGVDVAEPSCPGSKRPGTFEPLRVEVADGSQARVGLLPPGGQVILGYEPTTNQCTPQGR